MQRCVLAPIAADQKTPCWRSCNLRFAALCEKPLNILVRDTRKKENLVEIALPCEFGFPLREAGVLDQFAEGERAQGYDGDSGVFGEGFEGISGCGQGFCHGNAGEAAEANWWMLFATWRDSIPGAGGSNPQGGRRHSRLPR